MAQQLQAGQAVRVTKRSDGRQYTGHIVRINPWRKVAVVSGLNAVNAEHSGDKMCLLGYTKIVVNDDHTPDTGADALFDIEVIG